MFTQSKGGHEGEPYEPASVSLAFRGVRDSLGIKDLKLHDTGTKMRRAGIGIGIDVISKVLGHSDIKTTRRYTHVEPELLRAAVNSVQAPVASPLPDEAKAPTEQPPRKRVQLV